MPAFHAVQQAVSGPPHESVCNPCGYVAAPVVDVHHTPTLIFKRRAQDARPPSHSLKISEQPSTFCTPFKAGLASCKANLGPNALEINAKYVESSLIFQGFGRGNLPNLWHK